MATKFCKNLPSYVFMHVWVWAFGWLIYKNLKGVVIMLTSPVQFNENVN